MFMALENDKYMVRPEVIGYGDMFGEAQRPDLNYLNNELNQNMARDYEQYKYFTQNNNNGGYTNKEAERAYYDFYRNYGIDPRDYGKMMEQYNSRSNTRAVAVTKIPEDYKAQYNNKDAVESIQSELYNTFGADKTYGTNFVDGKYGNNTASAMIDMLNNTYEAGLSNDGTTYEKTRRIQQWLKSKGFTDANGKDLVLNGKFGKNTASAFITAMNKYKRNLEAGERILRETEAAEEAQRIAEQQAAAYAQSQAIRAEQPNRNMFAGVNLPMPEVFARHEIYPTQPIDVGYAYGGYIGRDIYGRPVYEEK